MDKPLRKLNTPYSSLKNMGLKGGRITMAGLVIALTVMFMCAFCAIGDLAIEQEKSASDAGTPKADKENNPKSEYLISDQLSSLPPQRR